MRELGVSRGIVREAFRSLAALGLIEVRSGKRPHVRPLGSEAMTRLLEHGKLTAEVTPAQVFELRRAIELSAVELAAVRRTADDLEAMRDALRRMQEARDDVERFIEHDIGFHLAIARATQNPLFVVLSQALRELIDIEMWEGLSGRTDRGELTRIIASHGAILEILVAGDAHRPQRAMDLHLADAVQSLVRPAAAARTPSVDRAGASAGTAEQDGGV